jgi:hypothetical protein
MNKINFWVGKSWKNKAVFHAYKVLAVKWGGESSFYTVGYEGVDYRNSHATVLAIIRLFKEKKELLFTHNALTTILFSLMGFKTVFWVQGAVPHESFLRNKSKIRFMILNTLEFLAFSQTEKIVYVSDFMKEHYSRLYPWVKNKDQVIYCNSDLEYNGLLKEEDSFCYIGGTDKWQNVDSSVFIFDKVLKEKPHSKFYIATFDIENVEKILLRYEGVTLNKNIFITSLTNRNEIQNFLSTKEFGFLLRDDILVNNVSSPIKLAEYLSCDVNVITTKSLTSFYKQIQESDAGYIVSLSDCTSQKHEFGSFIYKPSNSIKLFNKIYK